MWFKKGMLLMVALIFIMGSFLSLSRASLAAPPWERGGPGPARGHADKKQSVVEDVYREKGVPAWDRSEHPSLKGLRNALANVSKNGDGVAAQVIRGLIEAKSVRDSVYGMEKATVDSEILQAICRDAEAMLALAEEAGRIRLEARHTIRERMELAWVLKKLGMALHKLGSRMAAEETLIEAAGTDPGDRSIYQALNSLYAGMDMAEMPVFIRGNKIKFDVPPCIVNGRTLVPVRKFAESLDSTVNWDPTKRQVVFVRGAKMVVLEIDRDTALINGQEYSLDVPPVIVGGRTLVPLRFVAEALDVNVEYFKESRLIAVTE